MSASCLLWLISALCYLSVAFCDTPANCSYEDVIGKWTFHISTTLSQNNRVQSGYVPTTINVTFLHLDTVIDNFGNVGTWTLIYNQGFEATIAGRKYFGFFDYKQDGTNVTSYCDRTTPMMTFNVLNGDQLYWYGNRTGRISITKKHTLMEKRFDRQHQLFNPNPEFINQINSAQSLWRAKHYKEFEGKTIAELTRMAGGRQLGNFKSPKPAPSSVELEEMVSKLPKEFDWRNVGGVNYVSPVKNQGGCGSCFSFSSTGMIEARLRIMTNNTVQDLLSEQDVVECSPYSQGCDGGFPFLIAGKYAENFGLLLDKCKPYSGNPGKCNPPKCNTRYHATNYHYVGGFYGACNSKLMQLALVENGPLSVSFEVYNDFMQYRGGIYKHTGLRDKFNPFEITNHAVLLVGYGVDQSTGTKFWTVKNSWGPNWGENGYFRIIRDVDEVAIESIAVESFPIPI